MWVKKWSRSIIVCGITVDRARGLVQAWEPPLSLQEGGQGVWCETYAFASRVSVCCTAEMQSHTSFAPATHHDTVEPLCSGWQSSYSTDTHTDRLSSNRPSAAQYSLGAGALLACAAAVCLFATASRAQVLAVGPPSTARMSPATSVAAPATPLGRQVRHRVSAAVQRDAAAAPLQPRAERAPTPDVLPATRPHSDWGFATSCLAFLAVPVAAVCYARRMVAKSKASGAVDLFSVGSASEYSLVPVAGAAADLVSLRGRSGCHVDVFAGAPARRMALCSGPDVQRHVRFAVFALFERFTEKAVRVLILAQEEARRSRHNHIGSEQLLLGIIVEGTGMAGSAGFGVQEALVGVCRAGRYPDPMYLPVHYRWGKTGNYGAKPGKHGGNTGRSGCMTGCTVRLLPGTSQHCVCTRKLATVGSSDVIPFFSSPFQALGGAKPCNILLKHVFLSFPPQSCWRGPLPGLW